MTIPRWFLLGVGFELVRSLVTIPVPRAMCSATTRACSSLLAPATRKTAEISCPKVDASVADGGAETACSDSTFGKTCTTAVDCGCDTGFCAGYPGQKGICSHSGCLEDASVCPATWSCGDFSAFQTGPWLCTPP